MNIMILCTRNNIYVKNILIALRITSNYLLTYLLTYSMVQSPS